MSRLVAFGRLGHLDVTGHAKMSAIHQLPGIKVMAETNCSEKRHRLLDGQSNGRQFEMDKLPSGKLT
jgi:hypothetical protein